MLIKSNLTISGNGMFASSTLQVNFLKANPSYNPDIDPRLPAHTRISNWVSNVSLRVENAGIVPTPTVGKLGYLRVASDIWYYRSANAAGIYGIGANGTPGAYSYANGTVVSILGIR
jgi:hypothetical protein